MRRKSRLVVGLGLIMSAAAGTSHASSAPEHWLLLKGDAVTVGVDEDLTFKVYQGPTEPVWQTMATSPPAVGVRAAGSDAREPPPRFPLGSAADRVIADYNDGTHKGHRVRLRALPGTDVEVEVILALAKHGELLVQIEQVGGTDTVERVAGLYDWKTEPAADTYVVVPHGSGYLIRADAAKPVALNGFVGAAYSLPLFGILRGDRACYQIIETWWDARVSVHHTPGTGTVLSLDWEASLGKLGYARRVRFRFAEKMDHVGMAKAYRQSLIDRGQFRTLEQQAAKTPALKRYLAGIEYRWTGWEPEAYGQALDNIRRFKEAGLPVTFFFPKWPAQGYAPNRPPDAGWQGFLQPTPVPGGWPAANKMARAAHDLGCPIKVMVNPNVYFKDAPAYDPAKATGKWPALSDAHAVWALKRMLDSLTEKGFSLEALYFDGYSAFSGHPEHGSKAGGPVSRRQTYEAQTACFRETRRRGIVPGAELARFWSIADCDFFFFTDWSSDRLRDAEPIPLVPLVFHDCYAAHFSGGGYYNEGKYDWYADRHPRLYELMYAAMPSHNWLPGGSRHITPDDWGTDKMNRRIRWLKRWHAYYQKVCYAEMTTHQFLNPKRTRQRVTFANDVVADFDLERGMFRVKGMPGFTGDWESPEHVTH